jgi:hypothetical protein
MTSRADPLNSILRLAQGLRELELTIGPRARPLLSELRSRLDEAAALSEAGDEAGAIASIRRAMEPLTALAQEVDPAEGILMRAIAERFAAALSRGDKSATRESVNFMRRRAGDTKDDPDRNW